MNDEAFRLSLIELTQNELLNNFINNIFGYTLKECEYIYIQYKIVRKNIVLNFYDNCNSNRFKAYIFTSKDYDDTDDIKYINITNCYKLFQNGNKDKLTLLGALLYSKDNKEKKEIITSLFNKNSREIFIKNFIL